MEGLRRIPEFQVHALCGPNPKRAQAFATRHAIATVVSDPEALLQDPRVDAVIIDTPDRYHAPLVLAAAAHRKHIFCEKPLATSLDEARTMVDAVRQADVRTLMGFSNRWNPLFLQVRDLLAAGHFGAIYHVHSQNFNAGLLGPKPSFTWRTDPARTGSGILGDLGAHAIDLIQFMLGPITEVCASLRTYRSPLYDPVSGQPQPTTIDDDVNLLLHLENGAEGTMALSRLGSVYSDFPIGHRQLLIDGSEGGLAYANGEARLYRPDHSWQTLPGEAVPEGVSHADFLAMGAERILRTFLEAIQSGRDLPPTLEDGLATQAVLHAAGVSSAQRCWVQVPR
jgi:predicted dehydrogenase